MLAFEVFCQTLLLAIPVVGLSVLVGYAGLPMLGLAAFSAVGAYGGTLAVQGGILSPLSALLAGGLLGGFFAVITGCVLVSLRDDYFALGTFALNIVVVELATNLEITRGPLGIRDIVQPSVGTITINTPEEWLPLLIVLAVGCFLVCYWITRSGYGRQLEAIRDNELAAMAVGSNVYGIKWMAFVLVGILAGVGGAVEAQYVRFIDPETFSVHKSIIALLVVILGGLGNLGVVLVACFLIAAMPEFLSLSPWPAGVVGPIEQIGFGLLLLVLLLYEGRGMAGIVELE